MSLVQRDIVSDHRDALRREPLAKRIRGVLGGRTVLDTVEAQLVWGPGAVLCDYAVPEADLDATVLETLPTAGVRRLAEPDLAGLVVLDFAALDEWWHEDERNVGHPRDPYHRVESLPSSRRVRVELDGTVIAESARPVAIFESQLPARFYLPAEDVRVELLPSDTHTTCAYKGVASYVSIEVGGRRVDDVAWVYPEALPDAALAEGHYCFDDTLVTVTVDAG